MLGSTTAPGKREANATPRMQALLFQAGSMRFAVATKHLLRVWPQCELKPCALAPASICGLLAYQQHWLPVVDVCQLLLNRPCVNAAATRLIIVQIEVVDVTTGLAQSRRFALLAERVLEVISLKPEQMISAPSFADWLGLYRNVSLDAPQLIQPELLMPEELARLYALHNGSDRRTELQQ
jgi:chemotaxis-related protein WspB